MKQRRRIYYTDTQKALMWERWRTIRARNTNACAALHRIVRAVS